ncbi:TPA: hypothetical protein HA259_06745 [Thermoplasmata archaeon]|nr:hypothetical protein [Thermoplasmata archaeon]
MTHTGVEEPERTGDETNEEGDEDEAEPSRMQFEDRRRMSLQTIGRPLTVILKSEVETTSIHVDKEGNVSLSRGALPDPDVVIEGEHATLCEILQTRAPILAAPGPLKVTINSGEMKGLVVEVMKGELIGNPLADLFGPLADVAFDPAEACDT